LVVAGKTFAFMSAEGQPQRITLKLPFSGPEVETRPGAAPAGYGLGRSGWVALDLETTEPPSEAELKLWLDESYRAQAPKRAVKKLAPP
jgi:hypothetical protein